MRRLLFTLGQLVCLFAASCSGSPGTEALHEKGSITQTSVFKPLFSEKAVPADLVLNTTDAREEKDVGALAECCAEEAVETAHNRDVGRGSDPSDILTSDRAGPNCGVS